MSAVDSTQTLTHSPQDTTPKQVQPVHLFTCVHGMWGSPGHVGRLAEIVKETYEKRAQDGKGDEDTQEERRDHAELNVLIAETNSEAHTYDGVDWGAERVVEEIKARIESIEEDGTKKVTKFSIVGYSLGGLLSRYVVGILHSQKFFDLVKPMNFHTIATPHIGLLRYSTFISSMFAKLGPTFLSRTGEHFYAVDQWDEKGKSLLETMSEPDGVFYQGLSSFENITIYANAIDDRTVPYITAAIEEYDPFIDHKKTGLLVEFESDYPHIVKSYSLPDQPPPPKTKPKRFTKAWLIAKKNAPSKLPPFLQRPFPQNVLIYVLIPIVWPLFITLAISNFAYNAVSSRRRIRVLEKSGKGNRNTIMDFVRSVEHQIEDTVVDFVEDGAAEDDPREQEGIATPTGSQREDVILSRAGSSPTSTTADGSQPNLLPSQRRMITNLNTIPHLKKRSAFIDGVMNSHGPIVARDVKRFSFHRKGEGVLRHLADNLVM